MKEITVRFETESEVSSFRKKFATREYHPVAARILPSVGNDVQIIAMTNLITEIRGIACLCGGKTIGYD